MSSPPPDDLMGRQRILVADEDPKIVNFIIQALREENYSVFHAYDGLAATELAFAINEVHLIITNTKVSGLAGIEFHTHAPRPATQTSHSVCRQHRPVDPGDRGAAAP